MKEHQLTEALSIIGHHIQEYENADNPEEIFKTQIDRNRYKRSLCLTILTAVKVLTAVTGNEYHWTRREVDDGTLYSGIEQKIDGLMYELTENYAQQ